MKNLKLNLKRINKAFFSSNDLIPRTEETFWNAQIYRSVTLEEYQIVQEKSLKHVQK